MYEEGATTSRGKIIYDEDGKPIQLTAGEALGQAAGFRPERLAQTGMEKRVLSNVEEHFKERRDDLYAKYMLAKTPEERQGVLKEVERYMKRRLDLRAVTAITPMIPEERPSTGSASVNTRISTSKTSLSNRQRRFITVITGFRSISTESSTKRLEMRSSIRASTWDPVKRLRLLNGL